MRLFANWSLPPARPSNMRQPSKWVANFLLGGYRRYFFIFSILSLYHLNFNSRLDSHIDHTVDTNASHSFRMFRHIGVKLVIVFVMSSALAEISWSWISVRVFPTGSIEHQKLPTMRKWWVNSIRRIFNCPLIKDYGLSSSSSFPKYQRSTCYEYEGIR